MPGRSAARISASGLAVVPPEGHLVADRGNQGVAPHGAEARRVHLDRDPVREVDGIARPPLDEPLEHRNALEKTCDVAEDRPGLPPIGGQDHERPPLSGGEGGGVVPEAREVDGNHGGHPRLPAAPPDNDPGLAGRLARGCRAARVLPVEGKLLGIEREAEERRQEGLPASPAL
jgi:hypothetical protein